MSTINNVTLLGRLGADPELHFTASDTPVTTVRIATDEYRGKKDDGSAKVETEWHSIVLWGATAKYISEFGEKGSWLAVVGSLQTRSWDDREGNTRYQTEIKARTASLVGGNKSSASSASSAGDEAPSSGPATSSEEDDMPF